ncbi:MAG: hypothetical protein AVDCRST_MAG26-2865 [uncultured Chloroflexia bacterium]|uniref:Uncharacterized protein n=1 Tax=uncultured Chloroflexia bacterium TaxID=1672391 RepID=A0A6J4J6Q5_9CHLR|nr:MAG: hypothetical protein AVDCRST_MAG26-2865 [uncultured Chloroflexia bacterium]
MAPAAVYDETQPWPSGQGCVSSGYMSYSGHTCLSFGRRNL